MIYAINRIENILHDIELVTELQLALTLGTPESLSTTCMEKLGDVMHSDYGILHYVHKRNMFVLTLSHGEELQNTDYISHMTIFSLAKNGSLNIDAGCGILYMDNDEVDDFDFRSSISITIDTTEIRYARDFDDCHKDERPHFINTFHK